MSEKEKIQAGKERLENKTHSELNNLRDSLNKTDAKEALASIDWLGRNTSGEKKSKKKKTSTKRKSKKKKSIKKKSKRKSKSKKRK